MARNAVSGKQIGFTLIELMIVIVIVAVLATLAYPAYLGYTVKANRAAAMAFLMHGAQQQQRYYNDSRTYANTAELLNLTIPDRVNNNYDLDFSGVVAGPPAAFVITADPKTGTAQGGDGLLSISNTGEKLRGGEPW